MLRNYLIIIIICITSALYGGEIDTIDVAFTKTVMLVFSDNVSVTPGSEDIQAIAQENKVIIVALRANFEETNIFVQSGNKYYVFIVRYNESPSKLLHDYQETVLSSTVTVLDRKQDKKETVEETLQQLQEKEYKRLSSIIFEKKQEISNIGDIKGSVYFMLLNMYVSDNLMFFKIGINNKSKINYDIQVISFEVRNVDKRFKPSSDQKISKTIIYTYNDVSQVKAKTSESIVYVLDKFTLDNERRLHIEMWEENGDRICEFNITSKQLLELEQLKE